VHTRHVVTSSTTATAIVHACVGSTRQWLTAAMLPPTASTTAVLDMLLLSEPLAQALLVLPLNHHACDAAIAAHCYSIMCQAICTGMPDCHYCCYHRTLCIPLRENLCRYVQRYIQFLLLYAVLFTVLITDSYTAIYTVGLTSPVSILLSCTAQHSCCLQWALSMYIL
jgi:hypothetical protein